MKKEKVYWPMWWCDCFRDENTRCLMCSADDELVWHHISYRHNIIVPLCRECHGIWHSRYTTRLEATPEEIEQAAKYIITVDFFDPRSHIIKKIPLTEALLHEEPIKVQLKALMKVVFDERKTGLRPYLVLQAVLDGQVLESFSIPFTPASADFLKRVIDLAEHESKTINEKQQFYRILYGP